MIVSPGVTLLVAGMASGVCFLLLSGKVRSRKHSTAKESKRVEVVNDGRCACCLAPFLVGRGIRCSDCGARSCRKSCSRWDTSDNAWRCLFCHQQRSWIRSNEKWFENFGRVANVEDELHRFFGTAKSRVHVAGHAAAIANTDQVQKNEEEMRTTHAVRNFVEKIVEGLVENVDGASISRAYENSEYHKFLEDYLPPLTAVLTRMVACLEASLTNKPSADPPAMAHAALREIVERAVEEARKLPGLNASADVDHPREGRPIADQSYEDLLATAILNKVAEKFQRERVDGNSNVLRNANQSKTKYVSNESEHGLEEDAEGCASYHDTSVRQNGDHREPVSFMMEEQIEEVMTITSDGEHRDRNEILEYECVRRVPFPEFGMDIVDPPRELSSPSSSLSSDSSDSNHNEHSRGRTRYRNNHTMDLVSPIESWEDNWLFQKKKTARSQPDAVAMLVPSSNTYYKALIGDRDAEDTTDLSECSSTRSDGEIEKELIEAINDVVPEKRLSEYDVEINEETDKTQFGRDEVDEIYKVKTQLETSTAAVREHSDEEVTQALHSGEKTVENQDSRDGYSEVTFVSTLITGAIGKENETKEPKDTAERGKRTIAAAAIMESSAQEDAEKLSEKNDQANVASADEDEEQRESEYTEHYDTAIQRHLDSLTKVEACSGESEITEETKNLTNEQLEKLESRSTEERESGCTEAEVQSTYATLENHVDATESDRLSAPPRPGTIAEREHKKWENAPPIENNPYSEESIRKRSWERRYSRKAADVSGAHYDVPNANDTSLELLTPDQPDIRRFGRDYYINQSKAASGERTEQIKSMISSLSRPSSSLSQRSSYAEEEQREQQVSHELERFEEASLHDSLPRRCCRDPHASPHFAINPLLHLERTSANDWSYGDHHNQQHLAAEESEKKRNGNVYRAGNVATERRDEILTAVENHESASHGESERRIDWETRRSKKPIDENNHVLVNNLENGTDFRKLMSRDWKGLWDVRDGDAVSDCATIDEDNEEPIIPRYDDSREESSGDREIGDRGDRDSGMCSIGSRDSETSWEKDRWRRLYRVREGERHGGSDQISSIGGRRFWTTNGYKYHTFGGIRIQPRQLAEDLEDFDESVWSDDRFMEDHILEFGKFKYQTFGGIKRNRRIDSGRIPSYRRIRLRPILPDAAAFAVEKSRGRIWTEKSTNFDCTDINRPESPAHLVRSSSFELLTSFEQSTNSTFEESDWLDEEDDVTKNKIFRAGNARCRRPIDKNGTVASKRSSRAKDRNAIYRKNKTMPDLRFSSCLDDEWQDEEDYHSDEIIMNKFLKDVSRRRKECVFGEDIVPRGRKVRSKRHGEILEEGIGGKLGKLMIKKIDQSSESLKESQRVLERKSDSKKRPKKMDMRSLSNVTIW